MRENADQKKLRIWTLFTQCMSGYKKIEKNLGWNCFSYSIEKSSYIEVMTIEITMRKNKILVAGIYKPPTLGKPILLLTLKSL